MQDSALGLALAIFDRPSADPFLFVLLIHRVERDLLQREVDFDEALAGHGFHCRKVLRRSSTKRLNDLSAPDARPMSISRTMSSANSIPPRLGVTPVARMASIRRSL